MEAGRILEFGEQSTSSDQAWSFSCIPGITVIVADGCAGDYLLMLTAQLAALMKFFAMENFEAQSPDTKNAARWLASNLSDKINAVTPIALREAEADQSH